MTTSALEGIRVVDVSRALAGPFAAMTLGDMGADVLKVEDPQGGDPTRGYPPFWNGESAYFISANRNKRSMTLNLETPEGRDVLRRLIADADVVIESFKTGAMEKWGLGWETLRAANPRLIYCAVSAVGRTGPEANRVGVDLLMQAYGGHLSITGTEDGTPVRTGVSMVDLATGGYAVQSILAALFARERTGVGQRVDVSLLGSLVSWLSYHAVSWFATGETPKPYGSRHPTVAPYGAFPTGDGLLVVAVALESSWKRFCAAVSRPELADHPRFGRNADRIANREELEALVVELLAPKSAVEWAAIMDAHGVPASPINSVETVLELPQVLHQQYVVDVPRDDIPDLRMQGIAFHMSGTPTVIRRPPPRLGEHTDAVLAELGFDQSAIQDLHARNVV